MHFLSAPPPHRPCPEGLQHSQRFQPSTPQAPACPVAQPAASPPAPAPARPPQLETLKRDPSLLNPAVHEICRYHTASSYALRRVALEDVQVGRLRTPAAAA